MKTALPFFSYSLDGYIEAKRYIKSKGLDVNGLRGFEIVERANALKEAENPVLSGELYLAE